MATKEMMIKMLEGKLEWIGGKVMCMEERHNLSLLDEHDVFRLFTTKFYEHVVSLDEEFAVRGFKQLKWRLYASRKRQGLRVSAYNSKLAAAHIKHSIMSDHCKLLEDGWEADAAMISDKLKILVRGEHDFFELTGVSGLHELQEFIKQYEDKLIEQDIPFGPIADHRIHLSFDA